VFHVVSLCEIFHLMSILFTLFCLDLTNYLLTLNTASDLSIFRLVLKSGIKHGSKGEFKSRENISDEMLKD